MARTRQLDELITDLEDRADVVIATTGRHTTARSERRLNQSIQRFKVMLTDAGSRRYLKRSSGTCDTSAVEDADGWAPRDVLEMPAAFYKIDGIDMFNGGEPYAMVSLDTLERNQFHRNYLFGGGGNSGIGFPIAYQFAGQEGTDENLIRIFPGADSAYAYEVWYMPAHTDLTGTGVFDGIAGWEEWVIDDAALQIMLKDKRAGSAEYRELASKHARETTDLQFLVASTEGASPRRRQDTRGARRRLLRFARGPWGGTL